MLRRVINFRSQTITAAAFLIAALSLVSRLLGMFRDRILAGEFGASSNLDAYYAAFRLPDTVYNLFILGVVSAGLIPILSGLISKEDKSEAWRLVSGVMNLLMIVVLALAVVLWIFAPWLMPLLTPGFDPAQQAVVVHLSRIMLLSPILLGLSAIISAVLQSFRQFFAYALAPIFYNIGIIIGALYFVPWWGINGLAWGVVLGAVLHLIIQMVPLFSTGYRYQFFFGWRDQSVRAVAALMGPRTLAIAIGQFILITFTIVGSLASVGGLTVFNLAYNIQSFPLGLFAISLAIAALPVLSTLANEKKLDDFVTTLSTTARQIMFFVFPVSVVIYLLRAQIVRVILGSGQFDWLDTRLTAAALGLFMVGLWAQSLYPLLLRAFYALHNTWTPLKLGLISIMTSLMALAVSWWIMVGDNPLRFAILAILRLDDVVALDDVRILALPLALSLAAIIDFFILAVVLRRYIGRLDGRRLVSSGWRIGVAGIGAGLVAYGLLQIIASVVVTDNLIAIIVQGVGAGTVAMITYGVLGYVLKIEELDILLTSIKRKVLAKATITESAEAGDVL